MARKDSNLSCRLRFTMDSEKPICSISAGLRSLCRDLIRASSNNMEITNYSLVDACIRVDPPMDCGPVHS